MVAVKVLEEGADWQRIVVAAVAGRELRRTFGVLVGSLLCSTVFYICARRTFYHCYIGLHIYKWPM